MRRIAVLVAALGAVALAFTMMPSAASARPSGVFYDASNADVWSELTQADKDAVEDFLYGTGRGDYTPWTAADVGGSRVPEDVGSELVRHFRSSIPTSAAGAEAAQSEVSAALQEAGMWPRIWQGLGLGAARGRHAVGDARDPGAGRRLRAVGHRLRGRRRAAALSSRARAPDP